MLNLPAKIYWCEPDGTVYWLDGDTVMCAPMNADNTASLTEAGEVEDWSGGMTEAQIRAILA